jgi:Tannase-like family of unknown function (DUF6351)
MKAVALALVLGLTGSILPAVAQTPESGLTLTALSARPDSASGGDMLVGVALPAGTQNTQPRVTLNGVDITSTFRPGDTPRTLVGLVAGLKDGPNEIVAAAGSSTKRLTVVNHPIAGPIFSGPHEQPFICETDTFKSPAGAATLGKPLDSNCSIKTRVDYYYRSTSGGDLKPFTAGSKPADLAQTTTTEGAKVPYIVRVETGTANRAIYELAMLHNPDAERAPDPWTKPAGWNRRLIYTHGGGCTNGWYRQGNTTGGVDDDAMLRQGYAVASASLSVFGNNCNDLLASETMMMVKERFVEAFGPPKFTMGWGCSGGSYQQLQTGDNFPGLIDGIIPCRTFPDVGFGTIPTITDARLLNHYFTSLAKVPYTDEQKRAVAGFLLLATMVNVDRTAAGRIQVLEYCPPVLLPAMRYNATSNPRGARCDVFDHTVNIYGRDPKTGFARRPLDNVGVQYGLKALNDGVISKEQFLELNERIGGFDNDGNVASARSQGDPAAIRAAYRTGRLTNGGGGLSTIPIIDYRNYLDDQKDGNIHVRYHSFSLRERLTKANGYADNHVMFTEDSRGGSTASAVGREAIAQMDRWLTKLAEDTSKDSPIAKVRRAKPADLVDACWTRGENPQKIAEKQTRDLSSRCAHLYPTASFPREVAGSSVASDIIKCTVKPVQPSDYKLQFTSDEMARLKKIFPEGVCDWSKPGAGQQKPAGTWLKFEGGSTY